MSLITLRERMEREFAAVRADLRRIESAVTSQRDARPSRESPARLTHAIALLRDLEWSAAGKRVHRHCPVCDGTEPKHADGCGLAAVLAGGG